MHSWQPHQSGWTPDLSLKNKASFRRRLSQKEQYLLLCRHSDSPYAAGDAPELLLSSLQQVIHPNCIVQPPTVDTPLDFTQLRQNVRCGCNFGKGGKCPYVSPTQPFDNMYCNTSPLDNQNMCMSVSAYIPMDKICTHMSWTG